MPIAQIIAQVVGTGLNILGTESSVSQQREIGRLNQKLLYQQAKMEEQAMERETELAIKAGRRMKASQYAGYAKSGAVPTSGTPLLTMVEQAGEMNRDILEGRRSRMIQADALRYQGDIGWEQAKRGAIATRIEGMMQEANKVGNMGMGSSSGNSKTGQKTVLNSTSGQSKNVNYGQFKPQMNTINQYQNKQQFTYNF